MQRIREALANVHGVLAATGLVLLALATAGTASAAAAPTWLSPLNLSKAGENAGGPQVAVDPQGDAVAVWQRSDGSNTIVQSATRPAGGSWSEAANLSEAGANAYESQVAVDPQGDTVAVWKRFEGGSYIIQSATRPAGGAWSEAVDLSAEGLSASRPRVAVDPEGNAIAVWQIPGGLYTVIQSATRPAGGAWSKAVDLSVEGMSSQEPQIAVDPQGDAVVVWKLFDGSNYVIQSATRPVGGAWSKAVDLSAEGMSAQEPQIAVDDNGDAVAVWFASEGSNTIIQSTARPAGGAWSEPVSLSEAGQNAYEPHVAVDSQGDAVALWRRSEGSHTIIQSAASPAGGAWSEPVTLSPKGQSTEYPRVAVDPQGDAVAIWHLYDGSEETIQSATRPAGGTWSKAVNISADEAAEESGLAVDSQGNAVAVWERYDGSKWVIQGAGYDAAGPRLSSLSIPAAGTVGEPLSFSVSPFDVWSALGATSWSFGDGGAATGTAVGHAYAGPGTYQVTLTAADALGNSTSATGTVTIAPVPAPAATPAASTTVTTPEARPGRAYAAGVVHRKGGKLLLRLRCREGGRCQGAVQLFFKRKLIAKRRFALAAHRARTLRVELNRRGRMLVRHTRRHRLKLKLRGRGVKPATVVLKGL